MLSIILLILSCHDFGATGLSSVDDMPDLLVLFIILCYRIIRIRSTLGFFEGCKDPREILWLSPTYTSRRSFLPYLFLYLLTTRFNINFYLPDLNEKKSQCITPPKHTTGVLANYPTHCEVISPDGCTSPFSTCNVITLFCPNNKLVDFCFRPENKGLFDNYCVRCVEKNNFNHFFYLVQCQPFQTLLAPNDAFRLSN